MPCRVPLAPRSRRPAGPSRSSRRYTEDPDRDRRSSPPVLKAFVNAFKIPDLRKKILFTLAIIAVFRLGSHIPVPDVDLNRLAELRNNLGNQGVVQFIDLFSGGALTQFAVFSLGIMPYITSS